MASKDNERGETTMDLRGKIKKAYDDLIVIADALAKRYPDSGAPVGIVGVAMYLEAALDDGAAPPRRCTCHHSGTSSHQHDDNPCPIHPDNEIFGA